jgi:hypothetical protein
MICREAHHRVYNTRENDIFIAQVVFCEMGT